jgi:hypothetical protein
MSSDAIDAMAAPFATAVLVFGAHAFEGVR